MLNFAGSLESSNIAEFSQKEISKKTSYWLKPHKPQPEIEHRLSLRTYLISIKIGVRVLQYNRATNSFDEIVSQLESSEKSRTV